MTIWWYCEGCGQITDEFESDPENTKDCPACEKGEDGYDPNG